MFTWLEKIIGSQRLINEEHKISLHMLTEASHCRGTTLICPINFSIGKDKNKQVEYKVEYKGEILLNKDKDCVIIYFAYGKKTNVNADTLFLNIRDNIFITLHKNLDLDYKDTDCMSGVVTFFDSGSKKDTIVKGRIKIESIIK